LDEFERTTVPLNKVHRDAVLRKAGIRSWYAQAGYTIEPDEYSVEPEHKGFHVDPETGVKRVSRVLSLDYEYGEGHGEDENPHTLMDLLAEELEADDALDDYSEVGESEDAVLTRVTEVAGLTKGEQAVTRWVLDGNHVQATGYVSMMSEALEITPKAAERAWQKARTKLRDHWYYEPEVTPRERKSSLEGAGLAPEGADQERYKGVHRPLTGPANPRTEIGLPLRTRLAWGRHF
jgi:hypothetical protein